MACSSPPLLLHTLALAAIRTLATACPRGWATRRPRRTITLPRPRHPGEMARGSLAAQPTSTMGWMAMGVHHPGEIIVTGGSFSGCAHICQG